jgi:hypothetical protein
MLARRDAVKILDSGIRSAMNFAESSLDQHSKLDGSSGGVSGM